MAKERIVSGAARDEDRGSEGGLRPKRLADYIGQERVKETLTISMDAARKRGEPLDHVLLYGPPGLGKTTLAAIIASEMGANLRETAGPAIERPGDIASMLTSLKAGDALFIDEIHRLSKLVEEILYPAMEDYSLSWVMGKGLQAQSMKLEVKPFTLVGATTRYSMLSAPLRDRFGAVYRLDFYDEEAMRAIVERSARIMGLEADAGGVEEVARRARGTPRVANRLLRRVRDYAQVRADGRVTRKVAEAALGLMEVDALGLDEVDHRILRTVAEKYDGGPVGLDAIAASAGEEADTIMDVYEPYLMQLGFLNRTPRGRTLTRGAYDHLGIAPPARIAANQASLWGGEGGQEG